MLMRWTTARHEYTDQEGNWVKLYSCNAFSNSKLYGTINFLLMKLCFMFISLFLAHIHPLRSGGLFSTLCAVSNWKTSWRWCRWFKQLYWCPGFSAGLRWVGLRVARVAIRKTSSSRKKLSGHWGDMNIFSRSHLVRTNAVKASQLNFYLLRLAQNVRSYVPASLP